MATFHELVMAKNPIIYFKLEQGTGETFINSGSATGSSTRTNVTAHQAPATSILGGYSAYFISSNTSVISLTGVSMGGTPWSYGFWYRKDTAYSVGVRRVVRHQNSTSNYFDIRVDGGSTGTPNRVLITDTAGHAADVVAPGLVDGNWHFVVVTCSTSGANGVSSLYVDGVHIATTTGGAFTNGRQGSFQIGGATSSTGPSAYLDEVFAGPGELSQSEITNMYQAATVAGATTNVTNTVTPMAVNITTPNVTATAVDSWHQTVTATADDDYYTPGGGTATTLQILGDGAPQHIYFKFPDPRLAGTDIQSLIFRFPLISTAGTPTVNFNRITTAWTEGGTGSAPGISGLTTGVTKSVSGGVLTVTLTGAALDTWNSGGAWNGVAMWLSGAATSYTFGTRENATVANRPTMEYQLIEDVGTPVTVTVTPMTLSVTTPNVTAKTGNKQSAPASSLTVSAVAPVVSARRNISVASPPMSLNVAFPGGVARNPDYRALPEPFEMWIYTPNANGFGGTDARITLPAAELTISAPAPVADLVTHKTVYAPSMHLTLNMVGMYSPEQDRYHNILPTTADADDVWLKMEETTGTVAYDALFDEGASNTDNGTYVGGPTLQVEGPQLRKAVQFDGVNDYVLMTTSYDGVNSNMDTTVEFSIKTTDLSGTVIRGGGNSSTGAGMGSGDADFEVRLVNGKLALYSGSGFKILYTTDKLIADNKWHHVVISFPSASAFVYDSYNISSAKPFFIMVDGQTEWSRYAPPLYGRSLLPTSVMARAVYGTGDIKLPASYTSTEHVSGSMRDFVVRLNYSVSQDTAAKLYYEWSESLLVNPNPITLNLSAIDPFEAKGNVKRMLALYGLPLALNAENGVPTTRDGFGTYFSVMAGYYIRNDAVSTPTGNGGSIEYHNAHTNLTPMTFLPVKPFQLEGYLVYPLAIAHTPGSSGAQSAAGIENGLYRDPIEKGYIDNKTGLPRFVDLDKDLTEEVTAFDAITAVNYPAIRPDDGPENTDTSTDALREPRQHNLGLTNFQWTTARDRLRDSILDAAERGVNLWITEPEMARHLGFIQAYDKHETGARVEFGGPGGIDATGYTNKRGEQLDDAHTADSNSGQNHKSAGKGLGQFNFTWQANSKRKIVATEPGLTTLPSYEMSERIRYDSDSAWAPHATVSAWDLIDRTGGLQTGDHLVMDMWEQNQYTNDFPTGNGWSAGDPRKFIVSAKPQGIVGKVISKEMDIYYGVNGVAKANPWKDNVYTIVAERGSVVRGRAIGGRAFIEFMDPQTTRIKHFEDADKSKWEGNTGLNISSWSFDTRRGREVVIVKDIEKLIRVGEDDFINVIYTQRYVDVEVPGLIIRPFISMNARGLNWLAASTELDPGTAKAYVPSMEITISAPDVTMRKTRNPVTKVTGTMRLDLDVRRVRNFEHGEVSEKALPMVLNLELRGTGKRVQVPAIELTLEAPDVAVTGDGDWIFVYMDSSRDVTLYLKED